jgi:hypothetical protein
MNSNIIKKLINMNKNKYLKINFRRKPDNEKKKQKG